MALLNSADRMLASNSPGLVWIAMPISVNGIAVQPEAFSEVAASSAHFRFIFTRFNILPAFGLKSAQTLIGGLSAQYRNLTASSGPETRAAGYVEWKSRS
jgi:hypothetical protein